MPQIGRRDPCDDCELDADHGRQGGERRPDGPQPWAGRDPSRGRALRGSLPPRGRAALRRRSLSYRLREWRPRRKACQTRPGATNRIGPITSRFSTTAAGELRAARCELPGADLGFAPEVGAVARDHVVEIVKAHGPHAARRVGEAHGNGADLEADPGVVVAAVRRDAVLGEVAVAALFERERVVGGHPPPFGKLPLADRRQPVGQELHDVGRLEERLASLDQARRRLAAGLLLQLLLGRGIATHVPDLEVPVQIRPRRRARCATTRNCP